MMKLVLVVLNFALSFGNIFIDELFSNWTKEHNKAYGSSEETERRFGIFKSNLAWVNQRNTELKNMTVGLNNFADMTQEEFSAIYLHHINSTLYTARVQEVAIPQDPDNIHVGKGCETPVRSQQQCGSCWAFSATGAAEGLLCQSGWLSPQELVDCAEHGCGGGWPVNALHYLGRNGACADASYPYVSGRTQKRNPYCNAGQCHITGIRAVQSCNNGAEMAAALSNKNFVSIVIDAGGMDFRFYKSGTFMPGVNCNRHKVNHAVLAVAISGQQPNVNCRDSHYRVKNSWGAWWGEQGYFWLPAGCNCLGVGNNPSVYPVS